MSCLIAVCRLENGLVICSVCVVHLSRHIPQAALYPDDNTFICFFVGVFLVQIHSVESPPGPCTSAPLTDCAFRLRRDESYFHGYQAEISPPEEDGFTSPDGLEPLRVAERANMPGCVNHREVQVNLSDIQQLTRGKYVTLGLLVTFYMDL